LLKEAWTIAIESLSWMDMRGLSEPLAFAKTVRQLRIDDRDALRLARVLLFETVRRKNFIDAFISEALQPMELDNLGLGIRAFLSLFVYSTRFSDRWSEPDLKQAETFVRIGRSILGWKAFLPVERYLGILLTQKSSVVFADKNDETRFALQTFHPEWFVEYCFRLFGRQDALNFLESDISSLPIYIRLNTMKAAENDILKKLADDGTEIEKVERMKFCYKVLKTKQSLSATSSFKDGLIYLQDKSSAFAAEAADPVSGMTVLDLCSAPGAVTLYLAQLMQNEGRIFSLDYSRRRMASWKTEISRYGAKIAEPIIADASASLPVDLASDLIVLNPPSTDTGLFARLPSSKWRLTSRSVARMTEIQWRMLNTCSDHLKQKGVIVYFTSSVTVEENEMVVEKFLKWHPEYSLTAIEPCLGLPGFRGLEMCQRFYPHLHECNGLFIARLCKID
jgi:16S rRNA (cytosine967-C5)-methyltransferase